MSDPLIHPSAVIDDDVRIGDDAKIWHFCHVSRAANIGAGTSLGQNVFVGEGVRIGARVKVQNNVSIYSGVDIADDVFVGPSVVFTNVMRPRSHINQRSRYSVTNVERGATIGANATIVCGTTIGAHSFIGAGSVVTKDVPPFAQVQGNPAVQIGWVDREGRPTDGPPTDEALDLSAVSPVELPSQTAENDPFQTELESAARRVLRSGQFIQGPEIERFEGEVAQFLSAPHAISCSNASDALVMALLASGVQPGDEVVTTPYSFFATAECIVRVGAVPVFVDIAPGSFHLDLDLVLGALTERTRAVLSVHLFGQAQDLNPIRPALRDRGVCLIEDAAQAFGATTPSGDRIGAASDFACFSFFPSKNLGGFGDGGLLTTTSAEMADQLRALRRHGARTPHHHERIGGNFRMDALQAALLRAKLPHVPALLTQRRRNAERYFARFETASIARSRLALPGQLGPEHTYNQFVIRSPERDALANHLRAKKINCPVYYPTPLHRQPAMETLVGTTSCPRAEQAAAESLALPVYPALGARHIDHIASAVIEFFR